MKIATLIARLLLGLIFLVFGLNGFLHFIPMPPPTGPAAQYFGGLFAAGIYLPVIFLVQLVGAILLLLGRFVPLALTLLAPIIVNILLFHIGLAPAGLPLALIVTILWLVVFFSVRSAFAGILAPTVKERL